ncbi:hypothetical protein CDV31_017390, partial [Fusarium ambrosium]
MRRSVQPSRPVTGGPSKPRRFIVETSVYDTSKSAPVTFSRDLLLFNITARIAGRTKDTNQLALRVLLCPRLDLPPETGFYPHYHADAVSYSDVKTVRLL